MPPKSSVQRAPQQAAARRATASPAPQDALPAVRRQSAASRDASPMQRAASSPLLRRNSSPVGRMSSSARSTEGSTTSGPATAILRAGVVTPPERTSPTQRTPLLPPGPTPTFAWQVDGAPESEPVVLLSSSSDVSDRIRKMIHELEETRAAKESHVKRLDLELRHFANIVAVSERQHRAEDLRKRIPSIKEQTELMRTEIATLRNSDRLLVSLREEQSSLDKHLRLRRAQVRQKEATIDVITKRYREQGDGSRGLLEDISAELDAVDDLCKHMDKASTLANSIAPVCSLRAALEHDEAQYELLEEAFQGARKLQTESADKDKELEAVKQHAAAMRHRIQEEEALAVGDRPVTADVLAIVRQRREAWAEEKASLLREKAAIQRELRDNSFHVRRGTNVKCISQYPAAACASILFDEVRELQLTLSELQQSIACDFQALQELERKSETLVSIFDEELEKRTRELESCQQSRQALESEQRDLREYEGMLLERVSAKAGSDFAADTSLAVYRRHAEAPAALNITPESVHRTLAEDGATPFSPEALAVIQKKRTEALDKGMAKRPVRMIDRLTTPTKSFSTFLTAQRQEHVERQGRLESVAAHRPAGIALHPSAHNDSKSETQKRVATHQSR